MSAACGTCGKEFQRQANLTRHQNKKVPCRARTLTIHKCPRCGKSFASSQSRANHARLNCVNQAPYKKACQQELSELKQKVKQLSDQCRSKVALYEDLDALKQKVANLAENKAAPSIVINAPIIQGNHNIVVQSMPGWPAGWQHPQKTPVPFEPSAYTLSLADLDSATRLCPEVGGGEPAVTASFLMELLRRVHSNPEQRNIYPNPNREDQVLTFAFTHWEVRRLVDAMRVMYSKLENELGEVAQEAPPTLQRAAESAQTTLRVQRKQVLQESRTALQVHLTNLRIAAESKGDWLEAAPNEANHEVRPFGREWRSHLNREATLAAIEHTAGDEATNVETAAQALMTFAQILLRGQPKNLTVLLLPNQRAAIWAQAEWQELPVEVAAARLVANMAGHLRGFIISRETALARLIPHLEQHAALAERVGAELLHKYTAAAEAHYLKQPETGYGPCQDARRLLRRPAALSLEDAFDLFGI